MQILLIGNFNEKDTNLVNGQTLKSDLIYETLKEIDNYQIKRINTNRLIKDFFKVLFFFKKTEKIILMLGQNGIKYLFPLIYFLSIILKKEIYYIVIGGWLPELLKQNIFLRTTLKKIKSILVESNGLKEELSKIGIDNSDILYNFRDEEKIITNRIINRDKNTDYLKSIFLSRVIKEKGIYDLIKVIKEINKENKRIILDIYGPLKENEKEILIQELDENIKYKGVLEQKEVYSTLKRYDLMIFPTYYEGEGQAGVIIEAMFSEVPVLASNWRFNSEFIEDGKTGFLYKVRNNLELKEKIEYILNNRSKLELIQNNLLKEKEKFTKKNFIKKIQIVLAK